MSRVAENAKSSKDRQIAGKMTRGSAATALAWMLDFSELTHISPILTQPSMKVDEIGCTQPDGVGGGILVIVL